jgi:hypothetical protein
MSSFHFCDEELVTSGTEGGMVVRDSDDSKSFALSVDYTLFVAVPCMAPAVRVRLGFR